MGWRDAAALALRSLAHRPARSVLTAAGVALGSMLAVAMIAAGSMAETRVLGQLTGGGAPAGIVVGDAAPDPASAASDAMQPAGPRDLGDADLARIRRAPHVVSATPILVLPALVLPCPPGPAPVAACPSRPAAYGTGVLGVDVSAPGELPVVLDAGRLPSDGASEVAVTPAYVSRVGLDPSRPAAVLGSAVEIGTARAGAGGGVDRRWYVATVVGVVTQQLGAADVVAPLPQVEAARAWAAAAPASAGARPTSPYTGVVVVADGLADVHAVRQEIFDLGFANTAPEHLLTAVLGYLGAVDVVLAGIGAVALAAAGLGVATTLLAAVRERWREIGVLKALGASDADVARCVLVEAGVLGACGGAAGTALALAVTLLLAHVVDGSLARAGLAAGAAAGTPLPPALLAAPAATCLLAVAAGVAPALRAARLPVREALAG